MKITLCVEHGVGLVLPGSTSLEFRDTVKTFHITTYALHKKSIPYCIVQCGPFFFFSRFCSTVRILSAVESKPSKAPASLSLVRTDNTKQ